MRQHRPHADAGAKDDGANPAHDLVRHRIEDPRHHVHHDSDGRTSAASDQDATPRRLPIFCRHAFGLLGKLKNAITHRVLQSFFPVYGQAEEACRGGRLRSLTLALPGTQPRPRGGCIRLRVRSEQTVKPRPVVSGLINDETLQSQCRCGFQAIHGCPRFESLFNRTLMWTRVVLIFVATYGIVMPFFIDELHTRDQNRSRGPLAHIDTLGRSELPTRAPPRASRPR